MLSFLGKIPWVFMLIIYLVVTRQLGISLEGAAGYGFVGFAVFVLFLEFIKSGDIGVLSFILDTFFAVTALIVATALLCYLYLALNELPSFFHWFGYAIIVGDAIVSPANAFRTALRNFGGGAVQ